MGWTCRFDPHYIFWKYLSKSFRVWFLECGACSPLTNSRQCFPLKKYNNLNCIAGSVHRMKFINKNERYSQSSSFTAYRRFSFNNISDSQYRAPVHTGIQNLFIILIKIQKSLVNYTINLSPLEFKDHVLGGCE